MITASGCIISYLAGAAPLTLMEFEFFFSLLQLGKDLKEEKAFPQR